MYTQLPFFLFVLVIARFCQCILKGSVKLWSGVCGLACTCRVGHHWVVDNQPWFCVLSMSQGPSRERERESTYVLVWVLKHTCSPSLRKHSCPKNGDSKGPKLIVYHKTTFLVCFLWIYENMLIGALHLQWCWDDLETMLQAASTSFL